MGCIPLGVHSVLVHGRNREKSIIRFIAAHLSQVISEFESYFLACLPRGGTSIRVVWLWGLSSTQACQGGAGNRGLIFFPLQNPAGPILGSYGNRQPNEERISSQPQERSVVVLFAHARSLGCCSYSGYIHSKEERVSEVVAEAALRVPLSSQHRVVSIPSQLPAT